MAKIRLYLQGSIQIDATDCIIKHLKTIEAVEGSETDLENPALEEGIIAYEIRLFKVNFWSGLPYFV